MAAVDLRLPDLFGRDKCKRTEDEKCLCLNRKVHNPTISDKAATIVSWETNRTSVEAARGSASHIMTDSIQLETRNESLGGISPRSCNLMVKLLIWAVCPPSAADGTKWAVKVEHGAVIFGIRMQRESRCSCSSSASVFHLTYLHLYISVDCSCCNSGHAL